MRIVNATEEELIWLQLHENIHRADLHPLDLAQAVQTLIDGGTSLADIARKLCKSETWVQKALTVAQNLSPEAKTEVHRDTGEVAALGAEIFARYGGGSVSGQVNDAILAQARKRVGLQFVVQRIASWDHRKLGGTY